MTANGVTTTDVPSRAGVRAVALVELPLYPNSLPLTSGYLQAYAQQDPAVAAGYAFRIHARPVTDPLDELAADLLAQRADVYALSCYLWNMRRMRDLLDRLLAERPDAQYILGGPQVMNHAPEYVPAHLENVLVCNGEGERTFAAYLRELLRERPDFDAVPGVSFWRDGELVTTDKPPRFTDLNEIPSPYEAGIFDGGEYTFAVVETNRGCPFRCTYCYWGAATNDKVHRWDLDRVLRDLSWISRNGVESIFIADANWGALPRDVELTRHLVRGKQEHGYPLMISMQAAKNRPDRVTEITEILVEGGLLASQPVSLQTVSQDTLRIVERANIKESTYVELQQKLHDKGISSYTELIWPLPGETLDSFRDGIARLCRSGADAIVTYPQLLLHNTPMYQRRDELGVITVRVDDEVAEADVVVGTRWVTPEEFREGAWFYYAVVSLYNGRAAFHLARELDRTGRCGYRDFLAAAAAYFQRRVDNPVCAFFAESVAGLGNYDINNIGKALHLVLHEHRAEMDALLADFAGAQGWLDEPTLRAAFELDLVGRPYVYREPVVAPSVPLEHLRIVGQGRYHLDVELPAWASAGLALDTGDADPVRLRVDHVGRRKMPYPRHRSIDHNAAYCQAMMNRLRDLLPAWTVPAAAVSS
ncbi:B12-binding domain-containing radical SAM protein [Micromonospora wenchangensis]|uniref:B12-binding domain-containing radical SAM protein n=1 Tax=Micromonospora wenchangensis TaxID=1185415 RepID=UPI0034364BA0